MNEIILKVENLNKTFFKDGARIEAVKDVSFELYRGECLGLIGESGSGKSTVANLVAGLEWADSGNVLLGGVDLLHEKDKRTSKRREAKYRWSFRTPACPSIPP